MTTATYFEHDGVRYSHTIDPNYGQTGAASACLSFDRRCPAVWRPMPWPRPYWSWATARGMIGVRSKGVAALFLVREGQQIVERPDISFSESC